MNAPYLPDMSLKGKIRRRITRFADRKPLPRIQGRYVSLSFDDFPKSSAETGARILEDQGIRATWYACSGQMGTENHFGKLCEPDDIRRLVANGHEIGCHTENHIDCAVNHSAVVQIDSAKNRQRLQQLGVPDIQTFAFPFGDVSFASKKMLGQQYQTLRGVQPGINHSHADSNQLLAVPLEGDLNAANYTLSFLDRLSAKPGWLIFYTHDVRGDCSQWGCTPELLSAIVEQACSSGFTIAPVTEIYQKITAGEPV